MAHTFYIQAPNGYGLLFDSEKSIFGSYVDGPPGTEIMCPDNYDQFWQYETKEELLLAAVAADPSFSKDKIYGKIELEITNSSPSQVKTITGNEVTLFCDFTAADPGITLTYQWFDPQGVPIPTATSNIFTFTPSSEVFSGVYKCQAYASGEYNWTGGSTFECDVVVGPKPLF